MLHPLSIRLLSIGLALAAGALPGAEKKARALSPNAVQDTGIRAPLAGLFAPADGAELRTIVGVPGAAVFGDSIGLPSGMRRIWLSPSGAFAIGAPETGHPVWSLQAQGGRTVAAQIEAVTAAAEVVAFSSDGAAVALYSEEIRRLYVLTGLPNEPAVRELDLRSLPGKLVSAALGDGAALIALGSFDGHAGAIDMVAADGAYESVWSGGVPSSLRFVGGTLLIADPAENRVLSLSRADNQWTPQVFAGEDEGVDDPGQIEVLPDRKWAVITNRKSGSVLWVDIGTGKSHRVELPSAATSITPMRARNAVIISTASPEGHWFLTPGAEQPVLTFISSSNPGAARQ